MQNFDYMHAYSILIKYLDKWWKYIEKQMI